MLDLKLIHVSKKGPCGEAVKFPPFAFFSIFINMRTLYTIIYEIHIWRVAPQLDSEDPFYETRILFKEDISERGFNNLNPRLFLNTCIWVILTSTEG